MLRINWYTLDEAKKKRPFDFHHISTDEVYGDLSFSEPAFTEHSPYHPSSPYSASKAASDHLVHSWHRTYGLPVIITNSSNNYGVYQHAEKLIPLMISNALMGKPLPIYGDGQQIRDLVICGRSCSSLIFSFNKRPESEKTIISVEIVKKQTLK